MKTLKVYLIIALSIVAIHATAQLKVRTDGRIHTGYSGYPDIWMGSYNWQGTDNGQWAIEIAGSDFNIWKPWPSPNWGNFKLFIRADNGYVGIGKYPSFKLDVDGDIATYGTLLISSDERLKKNISPLSNSLFKITKLNGKSYTKFRPKPVFNFAGITDSVKYLTMLYESKRVEKEDNSVQLGLLAQEVKQVFPELVKQDSAGYLTVDYIGLIPVIIEALKEQQNTITAQSAKIKELATRLSSIENNPALNKNGNLKGSEVTSDIPTINNTTNAFLYQNAPNPFTYNTEIKYYLPVSIVSATLFFYDMQGIQIKSIPIQQHGNAGITINGSEFKAGMYIYTLIADGMEVDTKRMILTN